MSIQIYYFSGTGNSLHVAEKLKGRLPEATLVPMVSVLKDDKIETSGEVIGLVFPIHFFTIPLPVKQFLRRVDLSSASHMFAVATRGGSPCRVFNDIDKNLQKKEQSLNAHFYVEMPNNFQF